MTHDDGRANLLRRSPAPPALRASFPRRIVLATAFSILNKLFDVMPEILIGIAIDVVVRRQDSFLATLGIEQPQWQLAALGALTLAIWVLESVFEYLYMVSWRNLSQDLQHALRLDAYAHVQKLDLAYFEDSSTGNLVTILNDDVNQLERFLDGGANNLDPGGDHAGRGGRGVLHHLAVDRAARVHADTDHRDRRVLLSAARAAACMRRARAGRRARRTARRQHRGHRDDQELRDRGVRGRAACGEDSAAYVAANRKAIAVSSAFIPIIRMAILAGFIATFMLGGWMTLNGTLNVGAYGVLVFLTQRLLWPLTDLAQTVDLYERAMASSRRILESHRDPGRDPQPSERKDVRYGEGRDRVPRPEFRLRAAVRRAAERQLASRPARPLRSSARRAPARARS